MILTQLKNFEVPSGKWMLPVMATGDGFSRVCEKFCITLETDRDDLDFYRFAILDLDGFIFMIEARPTVEVFTVRAMTGFSNMKTSLLQIYQSFDLDPENTICYTSKYDKYP
jgi:hypothetical protein